MLRLLAFAVLVAPPVQAHEFDELVVARHDWSSPGLYEVHLQDTAAGRSIVCALYDAEGRLLSSETAITDNLATRVEIPLATGEEGAAEGEVASARCVSNN